MIDGVPVVHWNCSLKARYNALNADTAPLIPPEKHFRAGSITTMPGVIIHVSMGFLLRQGQAVAHRHSVVGALTKGFSDRAIAGFENQ
jgi:hypothetical protein